MNIERGGTSTMMLFIMDLLAYNLQVTTIPQLNEGANVSISGSMWWRCMERPYAS